jgi:GcrA cell cycle regulator
MWTAAQDARLKELHKSHSFSEIADIMGVSRNAAIGRAGRLGMAKPRGPVLSEAERLIRRRATVEKSQTKKKAQRNGQIFFGCGVAQPVFVKPLPVFEAIEIEPRHVHLADLTPNDCRFPYGDRDLTFCGHPKLPHSSYCAEHHALCWQEPKSRFGARSKVAA